MTETLAEARQRLQAGLDDGGLRCPCCDQFAMIYHRRVHASMARSLIKFYRHGGLEWQYLPTVRITLGLTSRDDVSLAYWKLIEEATKIREDGGRAGWWRVTRKGENFINRGLRIPKIALIYDASCIGFDTTQMVSIRDCLGDRFDYSELMRS